MLKKKPLLPLPMSLSSLLLPSSSSSPLPSSSSSPLPSSSSSSPLSVLLSMLLLSLLTPEYPIGHQINLLCDTKSANVSSRKKKKKQTHSPFQQTDGKVKEQGLSQDEQDTPQCISHAGVVTINNASEELIRSNRKCRIRPDKHQHSQNKKKMKRTWCPRRLQTCGPVPPLLPQLRQQ